MCGGLAYPVIDPVTGEIKLRKAFFPIPKVTIPVVDERDGSVRFCQWGRRRDEETILDVPVTGWARLISLKQGLWNQYNPRKVRIPAVRWMEKDDQKQSHWFDMNAGQAILGVLIEQQDERFVYVVTRPAEGGFSEVHARMPLLVPALPYSPIEALPARSKSAKPKSAKIVKPTAPISQVEPELTQISLF